MNIPVIQTPRLTLRGHRIGDFQECAAMWSDPIVTKYTIGSPSPANRTWGRMMTYVGHWELLGFGYWAIEENISKKFIGELGFADFKRDISPSIEGVPEIGWAFAAHCHGKGYATEALKAALVWGDQNLNTPRTVCLIHGENTASFRLAEKSGYRRYAETIYNEQSNLLYERLRPLASEV